MRLRDLAGSRVRYGYRRLTVLLNREGWEVNAKRIYRLYTEEGLIVRTQKRKERAQRHRIPLGQTRSRMFCRLFSRDLHQLLAALLLSFSTREPCHVDLPSIAVLIPCHNEEHTIGKVVQDFRAALPDAAIYVYDNNSLDRTVERATAAGATVYHESLQGKGNVVRRMFSDVEADVYLLVDGDDTYFAGSAPVMVEQLLTQRLDMVNGTRVTNIVAAYRLGHRFGNNMLSGLVRRTFGSRVKDLLSGYRVFSRRFVKSFPALSSGFETETELTIHALELGMPVGEIDTPYKDRTEGSVSKLRTYSDGIRILRTIVMLIKNERPLMFFSTMALLLFVAAIGLGIPIFVEFYRTHLVPRFPTAILATGLVMLSFLSMVCGLILDSVARGRKEIKRMIYLSIPLWHDKRV